MIRRLALPALLIGTLGGLLPGLAAAQTPIPPVPPQVAPAPPPLPPVTALPEPGLVLTPEQVIAVQRAGHRLPGGAGPLAPLTTPGLTPQQVATLLLTMSPTEAALLLSLLTPEQARAVALYLPPGFYPGLILPAALPRAGDPGQSGLLAGGGIVLLAAGLGLRRLARRVP
jgi:hypothetical protein